MFFHLRLPHKVVCSEARNGCCFELLEDRAGYHGSESTAKAAVLGLLTGK